MTPAGANFQKSTHTDKTWYVFYIPAIMLLYQIWVKLSNKVRRGGIAGRGHHATKGIQFLLGAQVPSARFWGQTIFTGGTGAFS